jgi:hypothetical protein
MIQVSLEIPETIIVSSSSRFVDLPRFFEVTGYGSKSIESGTLACGMADASLDRLELWSSHGECHWR